MSVLPQKYGCLYIDITWRRIFSYYYGLISNLDRTQLQRQVQELFGGPMKCLVCTSVRSGLDLFLTVMNFPKGSEIIFTAINIPDMVNIVESHGIKVIPVDIDLETLAPKEELLELAITDKTVAVLVAHIYGKWIEMDKITEIAHSNGLLVLEDCAECFQGFKHRENDNSDLAFYSFGFIKYSTCLGGAVVKVNDIGLLEKMRTKLESYPIQSSWMCFSKVAKYSILTFLLNNALLAWTLIPLFHKVNFDYKEFFISLLRGYPGQIIPQLRYQPSTAMLKVMHDVLSNVNDMSFDITKIKGDFVAGNMPGNVFVPGMKSRIVNYWLFPIIVDNPIEVRKALEREGIEAYQGATQLRTVYKTPSKPSTTTLTKDISRIPLHTPSPLMAQPAVTSSMTQSYTVKTARTNTMLASDITQPSLAAGNSTSYSSTTLMQDDEKPCCDSQEFVSKFKSSKDILYPYNAEYLINHVLYLPVHKNVPLWYLEYVCNAVDKVMKNRSGVIFKDEKETVILPSKL